MSEIEPSLRWSWAKSDYLGGVPVGNILKTYTLPRTSFYRRARREGWLREPDIAEAEAASDIPPAPPVQTLAQRALDEAAQAVMDGDLAASQGWLRVVKRLREVAMQDALRGPWRDACEKAAAANGGSSERNTVEQVEQSDTPQTVVGQEIVLPKWNSSTGFSDAELFQLEAVAADPQASTHDAAQAINLLAKHFTREMQVLEAAQKDAVRARREATQVPDTLEALDSLPGP
jgi:hypothetical protein